MSGLRGDDDGSGRTPPDPEGLPGFPAEWGRIVIPDDASELDREAASVRRELRREALFHRYGLHPSRRLHHLALPLVLVTMAVLVATTSLFAAMWPQSHRSTGSGGTSGSPSGPTRQSSSAAPATLRTGAPLPDLILTDSHGDRIRLRATRPAVVLFTRHCGCASLISDTTRAATKAEVTVLVVGATAPPRVPSPPGGAKVVTATEPTGALAAAIAGGSRITPAADTAGVLLVNADGRLVRSVPATTDADDFDGQIPQLT